MATEVKITFSRSALNDPEDFLDYYREQKVPQAGEKLIAKIIKDIELLAKQPKMGRIVPEFELDYLRELIRPPFRIVYRRGKNEISIVRIWRSERLLIIP